MSSGLDILNGKRNLSPFTLMALFALRQTFRTDKILLSFIERYSRLNMLPLFLS